MYGNKEENECSFVSSMKTVFVAFSRVIRLKVESYFRQLFLTSYTKINPKHSEFLKKLTLVTSMHSGGMRPPASVRGVSAWRFLPRGWCVCLRGSGWGGGVCPGGVHLLWTQRQTTFPLASWDTSPSPLHAGIHNTTPPSPVARSNDTHL